MRRLKGKGNYIYRRPQHRRLDVDAEIVNPEYINYRYWRPFLVWFILESSLLLSHSSSSSWTLLAMIAITMTEEKLIYDDEDEGKVINCNKRGYGVDLPSLCYVSCNNVWRRTLSIMCGKITELVLKTINSFIAVCWWSVKAWLRAFTFVFL